MKLHRKFKIETPEILNLEEFSVLGAKTYD